LVRINYGPTDRAGTQIQPENIIDLLLLGHLKSPDEVLDKSI
jgi:hypothetical protein